MRHGHGSERTGCVRSSFGGRYAMNVLMVIDALALGGAERLAVELANALGRRGVTTVLCASRRGGPLAATLADDVKLVILGRRHRWDLSGLAGLRRVAQDRSIDIVHSHGRSSMRFVAVARLLRLLTAAHVFHDHSSAGATSRPPLLQEMLPLLLTVDGYIGTDPRLAERVRAALPPDRIRVVRNWVDPGRFDIEALDVRVEFGLEGSGAVIAFVANLRSPKDHGTFLRALAATEDATTAALLVGETSSDPEYVRVVRATVEQYGLGHRVRLTGPRDDIPAILAGCDVGAFSSHRETGPVAVLEYLAAGLPVACTDTGDIVATVRSFGLAHVVAPGDWYALAQALHSCVHLSADGRAVHRERARAVVQTHFGIDTAAAQVVSLYRAVIGGEPDGPR